MLARPECVQRVELAVQPRLSEPEIAARHSLTRIEQAGGIVVRNDGDGLSVLLVRAKKDPALWIFPKGHIEPGETAEAAALRETQEETGVQGALVAPVGEPLEFQSGAELVRVQYFLIRPITESPSPEGREKRWFARWPSRMPGDYSMKFQISDLRFQIEMRIEDAVARSRPVERRLGLLRSW
ncbi:MAG: hypothetical protein DMF97_10035 [Acidobacteria bacterium]|nr:MAG: hypothetical protein DMF97_10035 [Acidobacteriota bacterium]